MKCNHAQRGQCLLNSEDNTQDGLIEKHDDPAKLWLINISLGFVQRRMSFHRPTPYFSNSFGVITGSFGPFLYGIDIVASRASAQI